MTISGGKGGIHEGMSEDENRSLAELMEDTEDSEDQSHGKTHGKQGWADWFGGRRRTRRRRDPNPRRRTCYCHKYPQGYGYWPCGMCSSR